MLRVVCASANPHKVAEISELMNGVVDLQPRPTEIADVVEGRQLEFRQVSPISLFFLELCEVAPNPVFVFFFGDGNYCFLTLQLTKIRVQLIVVRHGRMAILV